MKRAIYFICLVYFCIAGTCFAEPLESEQSLDELISDILKISNSVKNSTKHNFKKVIIPQALSTYEKKMTPEEMHISKLAVEQFMNESIESGLKRKFGPVVYFKGLYQGDGAPAFKFKRRDEEIYELVVYVEKQANNETHAMIGVARSSAIYGTYIFNKFNEIKFSCSDVRDMETTQVNLEVCVSPKNGSVKIFLKYFYKQNIFELEINEEINNFLQGTLSKSALKILWRDKLHKAQEEFSAKNIDDENIEISVEKKSTAANNLVGGSLKENFEVITKKNIKNFFVVKPKFAYANEIHEELIRFNAKETYKWGFIDLSGEVKINPDFDYVYNFSEGLAAVGIGKQTDGAKIGFIDKQGKFVINPIFDSVDYRGFLDGRVFVQNSKEEWGVIDKKGNLIVDYKYSRFDSYSEGVAVVQEKSGGKQFFIDRDGKRLSSEEFDSLGRLYEGLASFQVRRSGGKMGYVDKFGKVVIDAKYDYAGSFSEGLASVRIGSEKNGRYGFIDKTGKIIIAPQFAMAGEFSDGLASVEIGGKWGFINRQGDIVITPKFANIFPRFQGGYAGVCAKKKYRFPDDKTSIFYDECGLIDKQGNYIIAPEFEDQKFQNQNGMISFIEQRWTDRASSSIYGFLKLNFKEASVLSLNVISTKPATDGAYTISIRTNADTASLKINGEELGGSAEGRYDIKRVARAGQDTRLEIVAKDVYGNTDTKTITVSRPLADSKPVVAALNPAQVKKQPERDAVAIIIGIADYKNLPRADYANDDARVFYDYAIRALGVKPENIKLLVDGDADDIGIYQAFKTWLPSRIRTSTDVYVYYSGHGLPTADGQGIYLLPQRAHRDFIDKTAITQAEINAAIQAAKPRSVTIFLDACYSGQARTGETLLASARPVALKVERQLFPDSFTVISASQADQISSSSPDLKHGIFSYYLMRGMEGDADVNRDGKITAGEMHTYLTEQVARQAGMMNRQQVPQLTGDANRVLVGR